jgi:hypothetical protein
MTRGGDDDHDQQGALDDEIHSPFARRGYGVDAFFQYLRHLLIKRES